MLQNVQTTRKQHGQVYYGNKTKELARRIPPGSFALLNHSDIDEMAALSLMQKNVKAVLNYAPSMTGQYPSLGTIKLVQENIPVYDIDQPVQLKQWINQGDGASIEANQLWIYKQNRPHFVTTLTAYTPHYIDHKQTLAQMNLLNSLKTFTENTLYHAKQEINEILKPIHIPTLNMNIKNRHVLVVTRGRGYMDDLKSLEGYIEEQNPVFIGVDGGADAILECGYQPHIILGDMDSVSERALRSGAEIVVHAYSSGYAPGVEKIAGYNTDAHIFPCFGTSEDAAQLLAYEAGALLIVTVGSHTNMVDFLEKGRKGMGSTLLVRLKIGEKLVDGKGLRFLYNPSQAGVNSG